ncbi:hypothetical protein CR162_10390 [Pseudoroseomonas rhizosphaerae]|uniref:Uncharacterized protein n=1 Tax=Teichococcus rhizosphaerae TaxID=1335062 RepID=A0A2C6Y2X1_9PROT|nr:hypothetical protein [Pseudoroseomonas rhizosphaerae]PHK95142.1 hypothetical protein CR162_10390 [Pseudoroseomonas rhizosphaerae]
MDTLRALADQAIRRVLLGLVLGIVVIMAGLAQAPLLALQSGALLTAALWLILWGLALSVPRRDLRGTQLWRQLSTLAGGRAARLRGHEGHRQLAAILAERLMWHADRAGMAALSLGGITLLAFGYRALRP